MPNVYTFQQTHGISLYEFITKILPVYCVLHNDENGISRMTWKYRHGLKQLYSYLSHTDRLVNYDDIRDYTENDIVVALLSGHGVIVQRSEFGDFLFDTKHRSPQILYNMSIRNRSVIC